MSVSEVADCFHLVEDLSKGMKVIRDFDSNGNLIYTGVSADWSADLADARWWIIKYTMNNADLLNVITQYSPANQVWNNRASIFP